MKVYRVSPIISYSPFFVLTYFSKLDLAEGEICEIDFNRRKVLAVVMQVLSLDDARVEIRHGGFATKKIEKKWGQKFLTDLQFQELKIFADNFLIPIGEILFYLFDGDLKPKSENREIKSFLKIFPDELSLKVNSVGNLQNSQEVFVCGKKIFENLNKYDFEQIIINDFNFTKYIQYQNPHISTLDLLFLYLKIFTKNKIKIILNTNFLGVSEKVFLNDNVNKNKLFGKLNCEILMNENEAKKFIVKVSKDSLINEEEIFTKEVLEKLNESKKCFLFVLSSGFANSIFCKDCKKPYGCDNCEHFYSLLNVEDKRFLYCKNCKHKKTLEIDQYLICKNCGGWGMFSYGLGLQKVYESLSEFFKKEELLLIDESEKKLTSKQIVNKIEIFMKDDNKILIGSLRTLKVLENISPKINTFVISLGPLLKGKYFDSDEKFLEIISRMENFSEKLFLYKRPGDEFSLENYKNKELFLQEEIVFRKKVNFPPFTKIVSLIFYLRDKRSVTKFIEKEFIKNDGETKKGNRIIYYWLVKKEDLYKFKILRNFGEIVISNTIYENFINKK